MTRTSKFRLMYWITFALSILCNVCPLAVYIIKALFEADLVQEKVSLSMTVFLVLIMSVIARFNKIALRSRLWIILIGIYMCLDYLITPLIIIAVCQVLDELIFSPLAHSFEHKLIINKEMDKR